MSDLPFQTCHRAESIGRIANLVLQLDISFRILSHKYCLHFQFDQSERCTAHTAEKAQILLPTARIAANLPLLPVVVTERCQAWQSRDAVILTIA